MLKAHASLEMQLPTCTCSIPTFRSHLHETMKRSIVLTQACSHSWLTTTGAATMVTTGELDQLFVVKDGDSQCPEFSIVLELIVVIANGVNFPMM